MLGIHVPLHQLIRNCKYSTSDMKKLLLALTVVILFGILLVSCKPVKSVLPTEKDKDIKLSVTDKNCSIFFNNK